VENLVNSSAAAGLADAVSLLEELLGVEAHQADVAGQREEDFDAVVEAGDEVFLVELKRSGSPASMASAVPRLRAAAARRGPSASPLLVVPYMPPTAGELASKNGVSWLDLSGNAHIRTPRTLVRIEGRPNRYKRRGRPSTPFAPKASRLVRWFLMHPGESATQQQLAVETQVDQAQVSRTARVLLEQALLQRNDDGSLRAPNLALLLDAWRAEYQFDRHHIVEGHVPGRSGQDTLERLVNAMRDHELRYALTGLAAAWLLTEYASFRLVTAFVPDPIPKGVLDAVGFRPGRRGANVWLVTPNDEGVFAGATEVGVAVCAHPVQVYLDLAAQPERAGEAAEELRQRLLVGT